MRSENSKMKLMRCYCTFETGANNYMYSFFRTTSQVVVALLAARQSVTSQLVPYLAHLGALQGWVSVASQRAPSPLAL